MMNKKIIFTAVLALTFGSVIFAQGYGYMGGGYGRGGRGGYGHMGGGYGRGACGYGAGYGYGSGYGYSQDEQAKIDTIYQKYFAEMEKLRASMFANNSEIRVEMNQKNPNQTKINTLIDQQSKLRADMDKLRLKIDNEIRSALGR